MLFFIGRGFAELQILKKKENGPISWTEWNIAIVEYCDEILHTHWYTDKM